MNTFGARHRQRKGYGSTKIVHNNLNNKEIADMGKTYPKKTSTV